MLHRISFVILLASGLTSVAFGQPAAAPWAPPPPIAAPAPRPVVTEYILVPAPSRFGTREVWQDYAVDSQGRFRPRVILAPYESSYYHYNGAPYRFFPSRNLSLIPSTN